MPIRRTRPGTPAKSPPSAAEEHRRRHRDRATGRRRRPGGAPGRYAFPAAAAQVFPLPGASGCSKPSLTGHCGVRPSSRWRRLLRARRMLARSAPGGVAEMQSPHLLAESHLAMAVYEIAARAEEEVSAVFPVLPQHSGDRLAHPSSFFFRPRQLGAHLLSSHAAIAIRQALRQIFRKSRQDPHRPGELRGAAHAGHPMELA